MFTQHATSLTPHATSTFAVQTAFRPAFRTGRSLIWALLFTLGTLPGQAEDKSAAPSGPAGAAAAIADRPIPGKATLKDGRILEGTVIEQSGVITVVAEKALYQFPKSDVASFSLSANPPAVPALPDRNESAAAVTDGGQPDKSDSGSHEGAEINEASFADPTGVVAPESTGTEPTPPPVEGEEPPVVAEATEPAPAVVDTTESTILIDDAKNPIVTLHTNRGNLTLELFEDDAPNTVANFVKLCSDKFYKGTRFHRIIKGFMMQGGDPNTKTGNEYTWGQGGPGYRFEDECRPVVKLKNKRGWISMANAGPDTNGSQFFLLFADANYLDGKHTVFGKLSDESMKVLDDVEQNVADPSPGSQKPLSPVFIEDVTVTRKRSHTYGPKVIGQ